MYPNPIKLLNITIKNANSGDNWTSIDQTDPYLNSVYQWTLELQLGGNPTFNSDPNLSTPYQYDCSNIEVGDWICSNDNGLALRIVSIVGTPDTYTATIIAEDVDRFNTISDPTQSGFGGGPTAASGIIFQVTDDGDPILAGITPSQLDTTFATDLISRFAYRNSLKNYIPKYQASFYPSIGDFIFLDIDGKYKNISSANATQTNLQKIIGVVKDINIPDIGWFTFEPRGKYKPNINPPLPGSIAGSLIYIDSTSSIAGSLTTMAPASNPTPVYIRLDSSTEGIFLLGGMGIGSGSTGTSGSSSGNAGDLITNAGNNTEVITDLSGYANEVVVKANSQIITEFKASSGSLTATLNEHLVVSNSTGVVQFSAIDSSGTNNVNLAILPQGNGFVSIGTNGPGVIDANPGSSLSIQGGTDTLTTSAGNLYLSGGNATTGFNNAGNVYIFGGSSVTGLGNPGIVSVQDSLQHNILDFLSNSGTFGNWLQIANAPTNTNPSLNSVVLNVATGSTDTNVGVIMAPKGQGLIRVANPTIYNNSLAIDAGVDALVTKGYLASIISTGSLNPYGGFTSSYSIGIALSTLSNILNVNVGTVTITTNSSNNLIVNSSSKLHQVLHSSGVTGNEATWGYVTRLHDTLGNTIVVATAAVNPVNYLSMQSATTNSPVLISAIGADGTISVVISAKGTGFIQANSGYTANLQSNTLVPTEAFVTAGYVANFTSSNSSASIAVSEVASVAAMNALSAKSGSVANVASTQQTYIYDGASWQPVLVPAGIGGVSSVNSLTGAVNLAAGNIHTSFSPTNYFANADDIRDHLVGIDVKLGGLTSGTVNFTLISDNAPQLGTNLDVNGYKITTTQTNGNIVLEPRGIGVIRLGAFSIPSIDGLSGQSLTTNGNGVLSWVTPFAGSWYNLANRPFIPTALSQLSNDAGFVSVAPTFLLEMLTDVNITSAAVGQVLQYTGTKWINATIMAAFDGNYYELNNLPTIPTLVSQLLDSPNYLTINQSIRMYGDVNGSGTTSIPLTLPSIVPSGAYSKVYVNTKGQVTLGSSIGYSDVVNGLGFTPLNPNQLGISSGIATLDSSGRLPTSQLSSSVLGAVVYQGVWNAAANSPALASNVGTKGNYYVVSTAGTTSINGTNVWAVGDTIIFNGTVWNRIGSVQSAVFQVNGQLGNVTLNVNNLNDVSLAGVTTGQILGWNGSKWINTISAAMVSKLSELSDTSITSTTAGDTLTFDGSSWVNTLVPTITALAGLATDVSITDPYYGEFLQYNGSLWVNASPFASENDGTLGVGIFSYTDAYNRYHFRCVSAGSNKTSVVLGSISGTVEFDVIQGNLNLSSISGSIGVMQGGTGLTSVTAGQLLYASAINTMSTINIGSVGQVLTVVAGSIAWTTPAASGGNAAYIVTGSTKVDTSVGSNTVQISTGTLSAAFQSSSAATLGEMLLVSNAAGAATVTAATPGGATSIDLVLSAQGGGAVKVNMSGSAAVRSAAGQPLTIQPGDALTGTGAILTISGGTAIQSSQNGGNLVLQGGVGGAGGSNGQVILPTGYVPTLPTSVTTKSYVDNNLNTFTIFSIAGNYTALITDHLIIVRKTVGAATVIYLPSGAVAGISKQYIIKDGKGDAASNTITITPNGSDTIDGSTTPQAISTAYGVIRLFWDGTTWNII